ncbi:hypothetical protein V8C37DRAFT_60108 [Trichoderma ceciliae]
MDGIGQEHVADASLLFVQKFEDDMRVMNGTPKTSHRQPGSSDSSSTLEFPNVAEKKRKRMEIASYGENESSKKSKIASADQDNSGFGPASHPRRDMSRQLPVETWQHIFSLLSPHTLGALLRVSRLFHKYLDPASPFKVSAPVFRVPSRLAALSPDAVWRASRCLFWPKMPAPLREKSELDMWRFACSRSCQVCGQLAETDTAWDSLPWRRGPGNNTVSPIFPFFINSCGNCLMEKSVKEVDVLLSTSVPSVILPGLSMVFLTPDVNVVSPQVVRNISVPASVRLTKIYWPAHVESLQAELEDVRRFGLAATEEWIKGLESRGAETIRDSSRWERWYLSGGVHQMLMHSSSTPSMSTANREFISDIQKVGEAAVGKDVIAKRVRSNPTRRAQEVVEELKAQRRADIEARAAQLQPPISPSVLSNLTSFQLALQTIEPFDDKEWKRLKPHLLAQRKKTKQVEGKSAANAEAPQKRQNESKAKDAEELTSQSRRDTETLVRIYTSALADQVIRDRWDEGRSVQKKDCAHFATEVLAYVRKQFYAKLDTAFLTRRLTLDDMKWIFDNKIGPVTNHHWREFLFCNGCPNSKLYGFHAVVQHYAMKHANKKKRTALHWRAEWPEELPFGSSPMQQESTDSGGADPYESRVGTMASVLKRAWQVLENAQNIPTSIKIYVLIHHVAKGYQARYLEPAPFELFLDGLNHHMAFSAVSNSQGLACKLCVLSQKRDQDREAVFSLIALANHFHNVHDKERVPPTDWRVDMVSLPDMQALQGLQAHIRKNKRAFELTSDALPWLFGSEDEKSPSDPVPLQTRQSPINADLKVVDTASAPAKYRYSDEGPLPARDMPSLLPAGAVYAELDMIHEESRYGADVSHTQGIGERRAQHMTREPGMGSGRSWELAHVSSRTVSSRDVVPEPRRHLNTYYLHHEHEPHVAERPSNYPYYPDMELQRGPSHTEVGTGHINSRYYISRDYQQPTSSAPLYRYVPSYDRYGIVELRGIPNNYYTAVPTILREYRIPSNADRSNYTNWEPRDNAAPASRVYDAYASRYTLTDRRPGA